MGRIADDELAAEWHELMGRYHRVTCALDRELQAEHGISGSDFEILQQLYDAGPARSLLMADLAERVHLSQSALSRSISRLEKDGLVDRAACPNDRRALSICLTGQGSERYLAARPTQRAVLRST